MSRTAKVVVRKVLLCEVEVELPDHLTDEADWYDEVDARALDRADGFGFWETDDVQVQLGGVGFLPEDAR